MTHFYYVARLNSYVERLLDRISNGKLAEDRRNAIIELQAVISESQAAQLAFGAMGTFYFSKKSLWFTGSCLVLCYMFHTSLQAFLSC